MSPGKIQAFTMTERVIHVWRAAIARSAEANFRRVY